LYKQKEKAGHARLGFFTILDSPSKNVLPAFTVSFWKIFFKGVRFGPKTVTVNPKPEWVDLSHCTLWF